MIAASEADEAWWPPTLMPSTFGRIWLAWWIVQLASQSALRSRSAITASELLSAGMYLPPHGVEPVF